MKTFKSLHAALFSKKKPLKTKNDFDDWETHFIAFNQSQLSLPESERIDEARIIELFEAYSQQREAARRSHQAAALSAEDADLEAAIKASHESQREQDEGRVPPNKTQVSPETALITAMNYESETLTNAFKALNETYPGFRGIRGDGNCYYRTVMYSLIEQIILSDERNSLLEALIARVATHLDDHNGEYNNEMIQLIHILEGAIAHEQWQTPEAFANDLRDPSTPSDALLVRAARLFTARGAISLYDQALISKAEYNNILIMGKDAEGAAVDAGVLFKELGISGNLVYINMRQTKTLPQGYTKTFGLSPGKNPLHIPITVNLLLKPGHYDMLYSKAQWDKLNHFKSQMQQAFKQALSPNQSLNTILKTLSDTIQNHPEQLDQAIDALLENVSQQPEANKIDTLLHAIDVLNQFKTDLKTKNPRLTETFKHFDAAGDILQDYVNDLISAQPRNR